ncbi:3991_t:CDS:2, partial [Entrophospora sp. SA101]
LNNKFINGIKAEIGYMLDSAVTSSSAIGTFASAAWNSSSPSKTDKYCDLDECKLSHVYGCTLACGHYECFLLNLSSQCQCCNDLLKKGIIDNSNSFQNNVSSFDNLDLEENEDNIIETSDDESISLDSNIDSILNNHSKF